MFNFLKKIVGDSNDRAVKQIKPIVQEINSLEPEFQALSDEQLREKTAEFKQRLQEGETLDDILPEAFATVREAARRVIGQRHYDVQLIGGIVLHEGKIAEMKTGEGKTLVATLPLYLNALEGKGCHLITVNDYLAKVGAGWMGPIYHLLGLSVGFIAHDYSALFDPGYIDPDANQEDSRLVHWRACARAEAYRADITYGTNNEFGFDYLRDNMVVDLNQLVQRELHYAIVDEVDNILIDEARTPLIISGPAQESSEEYRRFARLVPILKPSPYTPDQIKKEFIEDPEGDFMIDPRSKSVHLTDEGIAKMEKQIGIPEGESLYDPKYFQLTHFLENAVRAQFIYHRDRDYVVENGEVVIVDEFTGRKMPGRRWSDGLHQAVEAKENVTVKQENVTLATITFQNYFRMYKKLGGMTGTAYTEREELGKIYNIDVVVIPTNKPMVRKDLDDQIYRTEKAKFDAVMREIQEMQGSGRPVLVGTTSVETSERLSELLKRNGIKHAVLNAKQHEREAHIVAQAGRLGGVTIATNMAGRGTDILLGGNPDGLVEEILAKQDIKIEEATPEQRRAAWEEAKRITDAERDQIVGMGGLHIVGTERHEARRIDNQLRGRSGRQGDPGSSRFYLSLEDELMSRFGPMERVKGIMERLGVEDDVPIEARLINRSIEGAQTRVEGYNFDIRKHTVEFDDVMNKQRTIIYADRRAILDGENMRERVLEMIEEEIGGLIDRYMPEEDEWDLEALLRAVFTIDPQLAGELVREYERESIAELLLEQLQGIHEERGRQFNESKIRKDIAGLVDHYLPEEGEWDPNGFLRALHANDPQLPVRLIAALVGDQTRQEIEELLLEQIRADYEDRESAIGEDKMRYVERRMMLGAIDRQWIDYLTGMEDLRQSIGMQAIAQRDPLIEFQRHAYLMFDELKSNIQRDIAYQIMPASFEYEQYMRQVEAEQQRRLDVAHQAGMTEEQARAARTVRRSMQLPGRNDPCPCGSGKKFKVCHLGREGELFAQLQAGNGGARPQPQPAPSVSAQLATGQSGTPAATGPTIPLKAPPSAAAPRGRAAPPAPSSAPKGNGKGGKAPAQAQRGKNTPKKK